MKGSGPVPSGGGAAAPTRIAASRIVAALLAALILASLALSVWYARHGLHSDRYWDERFSLENARAFLYTGSLRPANGYYQSLSYLPQTALLAASRALHRWTGGEGWAVFDAGGHFSPTAYWLCRSLQTLYGAGCLLMTFVIGRRLFSPAVGLLGAFFLAVTPWHVQASAVFKPDILLVLTLLLALWWSLRAVEQPSLGRFALAGCGVALALSTKLNAALAVVPVLVAVGWSEGAWRRKGLRLLAAGGASAALFVVLNPYFMMYPAFFARNLEHYTDKAETYGGTHLGVLWREVELLTGWAVHGKVVGSLALVAAAAFAIYLLRGPVRGVGAWVRSRAGGWTFASFPVAYSLVYAAFTSHFKDNNFLPILPFTSLMAAWGLVGAWELAAARLPVLRRPWCLLPAGALLVAALTPSPFLYVYRQRIPSTEAVAREFILRRLRAEGAVAGRVVYTEAVPPKAYVSTANPPLSVFEDAGATAVAVDRLADLAPSELDAAGGEIFPLSHLGEGGDGFYWQRVARVPPQAVGRVSPRPFAAWGPARVAIAHPAPAPP